MTETFAVLPTATKINPSNPAGATYYNREQVAYVLRRIDEARTKPSSVITSYGKMSRTRIGDIWNLRHDQTNAFLGTYEVVGISDFRTGEKIGNVPDAQINHRVFK